MVWINNDGLRVRFGTEEAVETQAGEYGNFDPGSIHLVEIRLDVTNLGTLTKQTYTSVRLPGANDKTCFIKNAEIFVETPLDSAGDALTLTIGLDNIDGTVFDADGIDNAVAQGSMDAVADVVTCDGSSVKIRLANTQPLYITTTVAGAVATAGEAWLRVWYYLENV